tara:strand:+ start:198 stop:380 length:183 start_codon:yes stop_codon:yes gene_type:complete
MKIKLKNKQKPIKAMFCFMNRGYDSTLIKKLNSGESVKVEKIPKQASEFVKEDKPKKENK